MYHEVNICAAYGSAVLASNTSAPNYGMLAGSGSNTNRQTGESCSRMFTIMTGNQANTLLGEKCTVYGNFSWA